MTYEELVDAARRDENILGLVLTGSRASGVGVTEGSDWDVRLIVRDDVLSTYRAEYGTPHGSAVEVVVLGETELERFGEVRSETAWDRYSWVRARVVVDETGRIARAVDRKRMLDVEEAAALAAEHLDDYVNWLYRSLTNARAGLAEGVRLDGAESISSLLDFLFAVHARVRPFNKQLRWELETHPLPGPEWTGEVLFPRILEIIGSGSVVAQRELFRDVESLARRHGLGHVVDAWEPDVEWLRGER